MRKVKKTVYTQMKEIMGGQLSYVRSGDEVVVE